MTPTDLLPTIAEYRAGLEAELKLLRQLERLSAAQAEALQDHDLDRINRIADERDRLMAGLVTLEHRLKPARKLIAGAREQLEPLPEFQEVLPLHRTAGELVSRIIASDQQTLQALRDAELARRLTAQALEVGETSLAAYRRVLAPPVKSAALVDKRG